MAGGPCIEEGLPHGWGRPDGGGQGGLGLGAEVFEDVAFGDAFGFDELFGDGVALFGFDAGLFFGLGLDGVDLFLDDGFQDGELELGHGELRGVDGMAYCTRRGGRWGGMEGGKGLGLGGVQGGGGKREGGANLFQAPGGEPVGIDV